MSAPDREEAKEARADAAMRLCNDEGITRDGLTCTGGAHVEGVQVTCTSPAHEPELPPELGPTAQTLRQVAERLRALAPQPVQALFAAQAHTTEGGK